MKKMQIRYTLSQDVLDSYFALFLDIHKFLMVQTMPIQSIKNFQEFSFETATLANQVLIYG